MYVFSKRYIYKSRLLLADCNITEHIEGDQCKFALWTGRIPPIHEYRMVLKAGTLELKQVSMFVLETNSFNISVVGVINSF